MASVIWKFWKCSDWQHVPTKGFLIYLYDTESYLYEKLHHVQNVDLVIASSNSLLVSEWL